MLPEVRTVQRGVRPRVARRSGVADVPDRGHRRRPAGGALRPDVRRAGPDEEHLRHRLLPAAEHRRRSRSRRRTACSRPSPGRSAAAPSTRWRAACSSAARSCSGCATGSGSSAASARRRGAGGLGARQRRRLPRAGLRRASARRTGTPTRAARSSASRAARRPATSRARRWRASPTRSPTCSTPCTRDAGIALARAARRRRRRAQRPADAVPGRPARRAGRAAGGDRDDGARRRLPRRARRRLLGLGERDRRPVAGRAALRAADAAREVGRAARALAARRSHASKGWIRAGGER